MTRDEATAALEKLAYDFHNHMVQRGIKDLPAEQWFDEFRSWLPSGKEFADAHKKRLQWLEEMESRAAEALR